MQGVFVFGVPYSASLGLDTIENSKEELEKGAVTLSYHHRKAGVHPLLQKMDRFSAVQNNSSGNAAGGPLNTGASLNVIGGLGDVPQSPASLPTLPGLGPGHGGGGTPLMGGRYFPGSAPPGNHRVAPLTPGSSYQVSIGHLFSSSTWYSIEADLLYNTRSPCRFPGHSPGRRLRISDECRRFAGQCGGGHHNADASDPRDRRPG